MRTLGHVIGGKLVEGSSGRTAPVFDPATGQQTASVGLASAAEVDDAVEVARTAHVEWSKVSLARRAEVLFAFREQLHRRSDELAHLITAEHGKVHSDALGEIARGLENVEFACGLPHLLKGGFSEQVATDVDVHEMKQSLGVVVGITPFNFPVMVPLWMAASAIACGNAFVLKPSEKDPSAALLLAELWADAGLPPGVFNVVNGDREAVERLIDHPDVAAISFVGSTPVARAVYTRGTAAGKRVQALGGAKNHLLVLPDADIDMAADAVVSAAYGSAGERCMAVSVVVAVGDVGDVLIDAVRARLAELRVGPGTDPASQMGPLITREHRDRVASYLDSAAGEGATVVVDGRDGPDRDGFFLNPSLIDAVRPEMQVYRDEVFGPVLSVVRVETYADAVALVNDNPYGNGTAIFTRDGGLARRFAGEVSVGMVGINVPVPVPVAAFSFGGWKDSLFGDTHIYGPESIHFYTRTKVVTSKWPDPATSTVDLGFPRNR